MSLDKIMQQYKTFSENFTCQMKKNSEEFEILLNNEDKGLDFNEVGLVRNLPSSKNSWNFSPLLKSPTITIDSTRKTAYQTTTDHQDKVIALVQETIDLTIKQKFAFKIISLRNWIGVGVGYKNMILSKNYKFDFQNIAHGCYLVSSNGYKWSHHNI